MPFLAYDLSIELIKQLREPLGTIRKRNAELAKQMDRAADSVALNIAEGNGRFGGDRTHHFRIAYGSLREVRSALDIAAAKGLLAAGEPAAATAHRLGGMLYRLAAPR